MGTFNFIYGSEILIQCQAQINMHPWKEGQGNEELAKYLTLIRKDPSFFAYWCQIRHVVICQVSKPPEENLDADVLQNVGTNIDDMLIERNRALTWSRTQGSRPRHVPPRGRGHGKQMIILKAPTFCAKDMGISFDQCSYSYSVSG